MVYTKPNGKKMGRPPKSVQKEKERLKQFESVIRTGGRVKKAKKVFDPSENNPRKTRVRNQNPLDTEQLKNNYSTETTNSNNNIKTKIRKSYYQKKRDSQKSQDDFCYICSKKSSNLIHCQDCQLKVHQTCIKIPFQNSKILETKWRCNSCKTCATCYENAETEDPLITCTSCVMSYHYKCHVPKIYEDNVNWMCTKCSPKSSAQFKPAILKTRRFTISSTLAKNVLNGSKETEIQNDSDIVPTAYIDLGTDIPTDIDNIVSDSSDYQDEYEKTIQYRKKTIKLDEVPDVSKWSCNQLANFIKEYFPSESKVLEEQEIDGACLLLLSRTDVIKGLKLKLGPAIRLYNFITMLQTKKIDKTATWIY